jgi:hypothetical protein
MTQRDIDRSGILKPGQRLIPLRGATGRMWGMYDPHTHTLEFRHGNQVDRIDLTQYQSKPRPDSEGAA